MLFEARGFRMDSVASIPCVGNDGSGPAEPYDKVRLRRETPCYLEKTLACDMAFYFNNEPSVI